MFNKVGDSPVLKVMNIKHGKEMDVQIAKCTKCGKTTDACHCADNVPVAVPEEKIADDVKS